MIRVSSFTSKKLSLKHIAHIAFLALVGIPIFVKGQSKISYDAAVSTGLMYWTKSINEKVTIYNSSANQTTERYREVSYRSLTFNYQLKGKIFYHFKKIAVGASFSHLHYMANRVESNPSYYGDLSHYRPYKKYFNLMGICGELTETNKGRFIMRPAAEAGFHFFEKPIADHYSNNYYLKVGLKFLNDKSARLKAYVLPSVTFMRYRYSVISALFEDTFTGDWNRMARVHQNRLFLFNISCGVVLQNHSD